MGYLTYQQFKIVLPEGSTIAGQMHDNTGPYDVKLDGYDSEREAQRTMDKLVEYMDQVDGQQFTIESYYVVKYGY
jgi:hypothetical protein